MYSPEKHFSKGEKRESANDDDTLGKPDTELAELLERIGNKIEENEHRFKRFETEFGWTGNKLYDKDGILTHITLEQSGIFSSFLVTGNNLHLEWLRGPDEEHITDEKIRKQHTKQAHEILADTVAEKSKTTTEEEQLDLPL